MYIYKTKTTSIIVEIIQIENILWFVYAIFPSKWSVIQWFINNSNS